MNGPADIACPSGETLPEVVFSENSEVLIASLQFCYDGEPTRFSADDFALVKSVPEVAIAYDGQRSL